MKRSFSTSLILSLCILFSQCSKNNNNNNNNNFSVNCSTVTNKAFAANISPLIQSRCAISGCHASGSGNGPGALITYTQISAAATRIRASVAAGTMPQGSTLSTAEKNSIVCWIDGGAPNN